MICEYTQIRHIQTKQKQSSVLINPSGTFWDITKPQLANLAILIPLMEKINHYVENKTFNIAQIQYLCNIIKYKLYYHDNNVPIYNEIEGEEINLLYKVAAYSNYTVYPFNSSFFYNNPSTNDNIIYNSTRTINEISSKLSVLNDSNLKPILLRQAMIGYIQYQHIKNNNRNIRKQNLWRYLSNFYKMVL